MIFNVPRTDAVTDGHVRNGQMHVPVGIADVQISGGTLSGETQGMGNIDAQHTAAGFNAPGIIIVSEGGEKNHPAAQKGQVVGNIAPHPSQRGADDSGVGILRDQRFQRLASDVDIHAADHGHVGRQGFSFFHSLPPFPHKRRRLLCGSAPSADDVLII